MTIKKPTFPQITPPQLMRSLDQVIDGVKDAQKADGSLDVDALRAKVADDPVASKNLEAVLDQFEGYVSAERGMPPASLNPQPVHSSCSGLTGYRTNPDTLDGAQVSSVMNLLLRVKSQVAAADGDGDGRVTEAEFMVARQAVNTVDDLVEEKLLRSALHESAPEVLAFFQDSASYDSAAKRAALRPSVARRIEQTAQHHAASPAGADALTWAYNAMMVRAPFAGEVPDRLDRAAQEAETSLARFIPGLNAKGRAGHLSDDEVKSMLGTDDLAAYAAEKKAAVTDAVGGDWAGWVAGNDIE